MPVTNYLTADENSRILLTRPDSYPIYVFGTAYWKSTNGQEGEVTIDALELKDSNWQKPVEQLVMSATKLVSFSEIKFFIREYKTKAQFNDIKTAKFYSSSYVPDIYVTNNDAMPRTTGSVRVWAKAQSVYADNSLKPRLFEMYFENLICPPNIKGIQEEIVKTIKRAAPKALNTDELHIFIDYVKNPLWKDDRVRKITINVEKTKEKLFTKYSRSFRNNKRKLQNQ